MRAAHTPRYGRADVIEIREVPRPAIAAHQILVEVRATPITAGDRRLRAADFPRFTALAGRLMIGLFKPRNPIQGTMLAGRVVEVGAAVTRFTVGDDVFGSVDHGAWAEYAVIDADGPVARMPVGLDYAEAAELPYGGVTALRFLRDMARVAPGERVLILGASGGVGRSAIQIARHLGAEVTAVCSARNFERVRALGAHRVIDHATTDFTRSEARYDVIFDIADATRFSRCRRVLTPTGRYLTLFISPRVLLRGLTSRLFGRQRALCGVALGRRADLEDLAALVAEGALQATVGSTFPLESMAAAHVRAERDASSGVLVVRAA